MATLERQKLAPGSEMPLALVVAKADLETRMKQQALTCAGSQFNFSLQKGASLKHHFLDSLCSTGIIGVFKAPKSSNSDHFREKK